MMSILSGAARRAPLYTFGKRLDNENNSAGIKFFAQKVVPVIEQLPGDMHQAVINIKNEVVALPGVQLALGGKGQQLLKQEKSGLLELQKILSSQAAADIGIVQDAHQVSALCGNAAGS